MDYIVADAYEFYGRYYPSHNVWQMELGYTSGKMPASGEKDYGDFNIRERKNLKDFFLAVYDEDGKEMYIRFVEAYDFSVHLQEGSRGSQYTIHPTILPILDGARTAKLGDRDTGEVQWEHYFDPDQKPEVSIVSSPTGYVDGSVTVRWEGFDAEGRELTYRLGYSEYEGRPGTWSRGFHVESTEVEIDLNNFTGSHGEGSRFRVIAFNGINFGIAESDLFTVPFKPAHIKVLGDTSPITLAKGGGFHGTTIWVELHGPGSDGLSVEDVAWISNIDGFISRGKSFSPNGLSVGVHTISAQVESKAGLVTTETAKTITILDESPQVSVRVGDGTGDLKCNEIEVDVQVEQVEIEYVSYAFNPTKNDQGPIVKDLSIFPLRYQMTGDTNVYVLAGNELQKSTSYRERIEAYDCEALQE